VNDFATLAKTGFGGKIGQARGEPAVVTLQEFLDITDRHAEWDGHLQRAPTRLDAQRQPCRAPVAADRQRDGAACDADRPLLRFCGFGSSEEHLGLLCLIPASIADSVGLKA